MRRFHHPRLLSQLKHGEVFHFIKDPKEWTVLAIGETSVIITDGEITTSHTKCVPVKMLKTY